MKIAICDDEKIVVKALKKIILEIINSFSKELSEKDICCEIYEFYDGSELIRSIKEMDAVFLDIDMPHPDGIETGKIILKDNPKCHIIMATGVEARYKEAFKIQAVRFITKPFVKEEIAEAIDYVESKYIGKEYVECYKKRVKMKIMQRDIDYLRAYNSCVFICRGNEEFRKDISLVNCMEKELDKRIFYMVNRNHIVNMAHIDSYKDGKIHIGNNVISVSRKRKAEFEKIYYDFDIRGYIADDN